MGVLHLSLRTDYGSHADFTWDEASDPDAVALTVTSRAPLTAPELRQLAHTIDAVADALESDSGEWRTEMLRDAGFVERKARRIA